MTIRLIGGLVLALVLAGAAVADPITAKQAKKALFAPLKAEVEIVAAANLPKDQAATLELVGAQQPYYGAIAISPDEGLMAEATVAAANYHDIAAASAAALAECNAKKTGKADCVVAALIRPKGWKDKGFQLSSEATAGFRSDFKTDSVMAISMATGAWAIGSGTAAADQALAGCAAKNKQATDCAVVIAN